MDLENENPNVYQKLDSRSVTADDEDENVVDPFDEREIFGKYIYTNTICKRVVQVLYIIATQI